MFWNEDIDKIKENLNTDLQKGLTDKQAINLLKANGPNALPTSKKKSVFKMCIEHLLEPFTFVLIALLVIAAVLSKWPEVVVISLIVILELVLSVYQERKAMNSLDSLKKLVKENAVVIREGKKFTIDVKNLVVGDLVYLEAGMFLPADVRIVQSFNLRVNESLLTGESNLIMKTIDPLEKENLPIGDRTNMAFMSTMIAAGSGLGVVVATGKNTEIGKITELLQEEEEPKSPLNKQITFLVRTICLFALALGIFIFCIQYLVSGSKWQDALMFTIALVVAVIPEGLSVIVTVSLSLGSRRMAKQNAIVKRLNAVETLGQVNVICSDKTGTLTENRMTVTKYFVKDEVEDGETLKLSTRQRKLFLQCLVLDNNSSVAEKKVTGDPTEIALLKWAEDLKLNSNKIQKSFPRIHELPFDSDRKLMSTVNHYEKKQYVFTKGAADNLLKHCTHYLIDDKKVKMTEAVKTNFIAKLQEMSNQALRVLGAAYREISGSNFNNVKRTESNLIFLGLVGMIDPPRKEIKEVLVHTREAGIDTKMITGDHLNTAVAIGKELTILDHKEQALSGEDIDKLSDRVLKRDIHKYQVFARVSPEHKVRIIKAIQASGNIVSMTGDGVNDAPSLKAANIGVAMGITGTDVAKEASQVVLTDDNFLTIVDAIEEGRNIYNKLKRIICFIIVTNLAQVIAITFGIFMNWGDLLSPLQVLWINLIVESFLAITMSMGPNNPKLMKEKPIGKKENILRGSGKFIVYVAVITAVLLIVCYRFLPAALGTNLDPEGLVYTFVFMSNAAVFYSMSFSVGRNDFMFSKLLFQNWPFLISVLVAFLANAALVFIPVVNSAFGIDTNISFVHWLIFFALSIVPTILLELFKGFILLIKPKVDEKVATKHPEYMAKKQHKAETKKKKEDKFLAKKEKHDEKVDKKINKAKTKIEKKHKKKKKNKK